MALQDKKILNSEVQEVQVVGKPKVLKGTVRENQSVFDAFADLIKDKFNDLIDELIDIDAQENVVEGVTLNGETIEPDENKNINLEHIATTDEQGRVPPEQMPLITDLEYFEDYMEDQSDQIKAWATEVAEEVGAAINGYWKTSVVTTTGAVAVGGHVDCPIENYTPNVADTALVYANGLRLDPDEYTASFVSASNVMRVTFVNGLQNAGNTVWCEVVRLGGGDLIAESWAKGTKNGVPVDESDPTYHNNSKYYAEMNIAQYGIVEFTVENGRLIMTKTPATPFDFDIDERGHLIITGGNLNG